MVQMPAGLTVPRSPSSPAGTQPHPARRCPSGPEFTGPGTRREADHGSAHRRPGPSDRRAIRPLRGRLPGQRHRTRGRPPAARAPGPARHRGIRTGRAAPGCRRPAALPLAEPGGRRALRHRRRAVPAGPQRAGQQERHPRADPLVALDAGTAGGCAGRAGDHPAAHAARAPGVSVLPGTGRCPTGWTPSAAWRSASAPATWLGRGPVRHGITSLPDRRGGHGGRVRAGAARPAGGSRSASGASRTAPPRT